MRVIILRPAVFLFLGITFCRAQDLHEIVRKCTLTLQKSNRVREEYTYKETITVHELNRDGSPRSTHVTVNEVMYFSGKRFEQTLEKDGKPLPPDQARREQEKLDKAALEASKLTAAEKQARLEKADREMAKTNSWFLNVPDAYNLTLVREQSLNGRAVYVVRADPKTSYDGKDSALFHRVKGTLYIDKELYTLAHLDAEFLDSYSVGLFLAKVQKGTRFSFEQVRVNDEIWLPKHISFHAQARALVKSVHEEGEIAFSDYRKFRTDSSTAATGQP